MLESKKVKMTKYSFDIPEDCHKEFTERLSTVLNEINNNSLRKKIKAFDFFNYMLGKKIKPHEIGMIVKKSFTKWEKINMAWVNYNKKNGTSVLLEDFIADKLKIN